MLGRNRKEMHVGQVLQEHRACRRWQGGRVADAVGVVGGPRRARRRTDELRGFDAELLGKAPRRIDQSVAQHVLQHVHAAEEHEHARRQQHRPQRRQALGTQSKDQRDAAPGPQRHRPVQRIEPQPLASQRRHDVVAEVVAQQRRFVAQIVGQIRGPIVVRQG